MRKPMAHERRRIGQILKSMGLVTEDQILDALREQKFHPNRKIAEIFIERDIVTAVQLGEALMQQWKEHVNSYEGHSLVVEGIKSLLGEPDDIFELQRRLVNILGQFDDLRGDLEALYQVSVAIAKDKAFGEDDMRA